MLPSVSSVSRSACLFGASGFGVRLSVRGLAGFVVSAGFRRQTQAALFARSWAVKLPSCCNGCVVKRSGSRVWVSVPVLPASVPAVVRQGSTPLWVVGSPPACRQVVASGGAWAW
jgi:hypothetical protein